VEGVGRGISINNCGRLQDLSLLFKIPKGAQNNFFKIYVKFGYILSKCLPALGYGMK